MYLDGLQSFVIAGSSAAFKTNNEIFRSALGKQWEQVNFPFDYSVLGASYLAHRKTFVAVANNAVATLSGRVEYDPFSSHAESSCNASVVEVATLLVSTSPPSGSAETIAISRKDVGVIAIVVLGIIAILSSAVITYVLWKKRRMEREAASSSAGSRDLTDSLLENVDF